MLPEDSLHSVCFYNWYPL